MDSVCGAGNHPTVKLRMVANIDVKTLVAGKQTTLFANAGVLAVDFALVDAH
ncbi:hypothetical protein D3C79_1121300 [compost metagenome]